MPQLVERRYGALAVIEQAGSTDFIDHCLKEIDPNLFLERQLLPSGKPCWCVCEDIGTDQVPLTFYEYRDEKDEPIPYPSMQIVEEMQRRRAVGEVAGEEALKIAKKRAAEIQAKKSERALEELVEAARDTGRLVKSNLELRKYTPIKPGPANAAMRRRLRRKGLNK